jgi:hypothetical protein
MQRFQNTKYAYDINIGVHSIMISKTGPGNSNSCIALCPHLILAKRIISIDFDWYGWQLKLWDEAKGFVL